MSVDAENSEPGEDRILCPQQLDTSHLQDRYLLSVDPQQFLRVLTEPFPPFSLPGAAPTDEWVEDLGPERAAELPILLRGAIGREPLTEPSDIAADNWHVMLLRLRYGDAAADHLLRCTFHLLSGIATLEAAQASAGVVPDVETYHDLYYGSRLYQFFTPPLNRDELAERSNSAMLTLRRLRLENQIRMSEENYNYSLARELLELMAVEYPTLSSYLLDEYKYLSGEDLAALNDKAQPANQLATLITNLKRLASPRQGSADTTIKDTSESSANLPGPEEPISRTSERTNSPSPRQVGETLEEATVQLLGRLFRINDETADALVTRLRRQRSGTQYGHDLQFEFEAPDQFLGTARCRVECKNYTSAISLADIADKLWQQKSAARRSPIDHWILISPRSNAKNELQELLDEWQAIGEFPFTVQIWSPQNGVEELFALEPKLFEAIYKRPPPAELDSQARVSSYADALKPLVRLPSALERYLRNPWRACFPTEDAAHFEDLQRDCVMLKTLDSSGRPLPNPLIDHVLRWLPSDVGVLLVLAEFGAGKSFLTYQITRSLAEDYLRDPSSGVFPLRLPLNQLRGYDSPGSFIRSQLARVGASEDDWWTVAGSGRALVLLDGFDEMSSDLDPPTVSENLRLLYELVELARGPETAGNRGVKVLVTSRGRFFDEPKQEAVLRERLADPVVVRIRPISRMDALANLTRFAAETGQLEKLNRIRRLYDPIGLAAKPLFLQMIRETLISLSSDTFSAAGLYASYVADSLRRKGELLLKGNDLELKSDVLAGMKRILESVAVQLHNDGISEVSLRDLAALERTDLPELLWRMATGGTEGAAQTSNAAADAEARVSIRSLLNPVRGEGDEKWLVAFFHRSVAEFFLAAAVVRGLQSNDVSGVRNILHRHPLSDETVEFVRELVSPEARVAASSRLVSLARGSSVDLPDEPALGGNALTLYYVINRVLPDIGDWSGLRLDWVRLPGADLRNRSFIGSSMRFASLDNADLRGTDLRNADLSGLRVERTAIVDYVVSDGEGTEIYGAYSDGVVRRWSRSHAGHWKASTVFQGLGERVRAIILPTELVAVIVTNVRFLILARTSEDWTLLSDGPVSPFLQAAGARSKGRTSSTLAAPDGGGGCAALDLASLEVEWRPRPLDLDPVFERLLIGENPVGGGIAAAVRGCWLVSNFWCDAPYEFGVAVDLSTERRWPVAHDGRLDLIASVDLLPPSDGRHGLIAVGDSTGQLLLGQLSEDSASVDVAISDGSSQHHGEISSVEVVDRSTVVTGGLDRRILVWRLLDDSVEVDVLVLTLRCAGALLDGVRGEEERRLLTELASVEAIG